MLPLEQTREEIQACVRRTITNVGHTGFDSNVSGFSWAARTDAVFQYNVRDVLFALDEMCSEFELPFDPAKLPQQSVFHTFPRLANFCAYLEFRLHEDAENRQN